MLSTDLPYKYHLNIIEGKLRVGLSELDMNDVKFMKDITQCFYQIWKFRKMYPELDAKFTDVEMSPNFQANHAGELGAMCEICEIEFPLLNNDLEYAYAMHEQTPEHLEMVDTFRKLQSLSTEAASTSGDRRNQRPVKRSATDSDSELRSKQLRVEDGVESVSSLSTSSSEGYDDYTHTRTECNNLNGHVIRRTPRKTLTIQKCGSKRKISFSPSPISSDEEFCGRISSIADIYYSNEKSRLSYFLNKVCIFSRLLTCNLDNEWVYECGLCDVAFMADETIRVKMHLLDREHRARVTRMIESINPKSATLEPCIFKAVGMESNTKEHPLCRLCTVELPEIYPNVYFRHVGSGRHRRNVKAHFNLPLFQNWERGVILRNGSPYCFPCQVDLPTERSMRIHINEPNHLNSLNLSRYSILCNSM